MYFTLVKLNSEQVGRWVCWKLGSLVGTGRTWRGQLVKRVGMLVSSSGGAARL